MSTNTANATNSNATNSNATNGNATNGVGAPIATHVGAPTATHVGAATAPKAGTFVALEVSFGLIAALRGIMPTIRKHDRDLADQIQRAASSVALNIAEGQRSMKGNRLKHYSIANGSANEVKAGLFVAKGWGWIDDSVETGEALAVLDRLLGLLWGLTRP